MKELLPGFCLYYILFTLLSIGGTLLGWPLQIPMAIAFLLLLYCSTIGRAWMEESKRRDGRPTPPPKAAKQVLPRPLFTLLLVLPPLLYLVIYAVVWSLL